MFLNKKNNDTNIDLYGLNEIGSYYKELRHLYAKFESDLKKKRKINA